jgi:hypothetical protein
MLTHMTTHEVPEGTLPYNFRLRNIDDDRVMPQRCGVCRESMVTWQDELRHDFNHAASGDLIPTLNAGMMIVEFETRKQFDSQARFRTAFGSRHVVIPVECLDATTNSVRVRCPICGDFLNLGRRDGTLAWRHYPRMIPIIAAHQVTGQKYVHDWRRGDTENYDEYPDHEVPIPLPTPKASS